MSDNSRIHIHDAEGKHVGDICRGTGTYYLARARWQGHRLYDVIGKPTKSYAVAFQRMTKAFRRGYKRAEVIMGADYYDPVQLCELVRR